MNRIISFLSAIVIFFVALFLYTKLAGPISFSVNSVSTTKTDFFTVTGEGESVVKPDIAMVSVGVQTNGSTVKTVQNNLNTNINEVIKALKSLGVDEKDIKTTGYSIHPAYDWTSGRQKITGYNASTNLSIKVRNIDKVNEVIDTASEKGANVIGNISFDVDDRAKAEDEARKEAVEEAKRKASEAAKTAGFRLGKIVSYSEDKGDSPRPVAYDSMRLESMAKEAQTDIQTGSTEIKITVTLGYEIE
ncbi:DUF541 domain-containing protein [Candidatus Microgenomates bacterium]|jgi:uncharacterized protein YggE|nr:MAG: DUF541 domain-containing protein [Candidatus Microgenomates bacterium]